MPKNGQPKTVMSIAELDGFLHKEFPEFYAQGGLAIERLDPMICRLRQSYHPRMLRPGRTISGPTLMGLADVCMYAAILSMIGPVGLAVTTNLNINFLRKAAEGRDVIGEGRLLKLGKRLAVGEVILLSDGSDEPVAHATLTYSIPPAT